jgi:hypothetical protein
MSTEEKSVRSTDSPLERLVAGILNSVENDCGESLDAWRQPERDLYRLARRDYVRNLRRHLSFRHLQEIVRIAETMWPGFNRKQTSLAPADRHGEAASRIASELRIHLQARPYTGPEGLALRGFYVERKRAVLKRPLIYVNTAHHPGAVATTFYHELGHHLTSEIFGAPEEPVHFFFDADYASHLDDPVELSADVLCSLRAYPQPFAREIFASPWRWGLVARTGKLPEDVFERVFKHVSSRFGLDLGAPIPARQRLNYLAGMIHYAKLRWALLAEYDL